MNKKIYTKPVMKQYLLQHQVPLLQSSIDAPDYGGPFSSDSDFFDDEFFLP